MTHESERSRFIFQTSEAFNVYLNGRLIDTVYATGYTCDEMRRSLINHDGYNPAIVVRARRTIKPKVSA